MRRGHVSRPKAADSSTTACRDAADRNASKHVANGATYAHRKGERERVREREGPPKWKKKKRRDSYDAHDGSGAFGVVRRHLRPRPGVSRFRATRSIYISLAENPNRGHSSKRVFLEEPQSFCHLRTIVHGPLPDVDIYIYIYIRETRFDTISPFGVTPPLRWPKACALSSSGPVAAAPALAPSTYESRDSSFEFLLVTRVVSGV